MEVKTFVNPYFIQDILCPDGSGKLASIVMQSTKVADTSNVSNEYQCYFVTKNAKFILDIEYPQDSELQEPQETFTVQTRPQFKEGEDVQSRKNKKTLDSTGMSFTNRIVNERMHMFDGFRQDSLVTKSLLDMTSYDHHEIKTNEALILGNPPSEDSNNFLPSHDESDPISFDDLGKIYKSISRTRILNNVTQCPNVHFHAHPDGSTTIHQHKSCPNPSLATLDFKRKLSNESRQTKVGFSWRNIFVPVHATSHKIL